MKTEETETTEKTENTENTETERKTWRFVGRMVTSVVHDNKFDNFVKTTLLDTAPLNVYVYYTFRLKLKKSD